MRLRPSTSASHPNSSCPNRTPAGVAILMPTSWAVVRERFGKFEKLESMPTTRDDVNCEWLKTTRREHTPVPYRYPSMTETMLMAKISYLWRRRRTRMNTATNEHAVLRTLTRP